MARPVVDVALPYQPAYEEAWFHEGRYLLLYGGSNSSKSWTVATKLVFRALATPNERFLLVRKVYKTCHTSVYQQIKDVVDFYFGRDNRQYVAQFRDSTSDVFFPNGSSMLTIGMDRDGRDKLRSIAGITSVWMEEASEFELGDFSEINRRLRGNVPTYKQIIVTLNPLPGGRWAKDLFIDSTERADQTYHRLTTVYDNQYATEEDIRVLEEEEDEVEKAIFLRGEWAGIVEGLYYTYEVGEFPEDATDIFCGLDFGYTSPAAVVRCAIRDVEGGPFLHVDELVYGPGMTNPELAEAARQAGYDRHWPVYCDASEPKSIQELIDGGIQAQAADKSVTPGIKKVKEYKLIFTPESVNLKREAEMYRRKPATDRYAEEDEFMEDPIKKNDHAMDAMRYAVFTHLTEERVAEGALMIPGI